MAHLITLEIGEGKTKDCSECPVGDIDLDEWIVCGRPNIFPDCNDVDYSRMAIKASDVV